MDIDTVTRHAKMLVPARAPRCVGAIISIILAGPFAVVMASCGTEAAPSAGSSTLPVVRTGVVAGVISAGPTCPVERVGHPCPPRRLADVLVAAEHAGGVVATTRTTREGRFSFSLPPGSYDLVVTTSANTVPRCPSVAVTVRLGGHRDVDIRCDTGIR